MYNILIPLYISIIYFIRFLHFRMTLSNINIFNIFTCDGGNYRGTRVSLHETLAISINISFAYTTWVVGLLDECVMKIVILRLCNIFFAYFKMPIKLLGTVKFSEKFVSVWKISLSISPKDNNFRNEIQVNKWKYRNRLVILYDRTTSKNILICSVKSIHQYLDCCTECRKIKPETRY